MQLIHTGTNTILQQTYTYTNATIIHNDTTTILYQYHNTQWHK